MTDSQGDERDESNPYAAPVADDGLQGSQGALVGATGNPRFISYPLAARWRRWAARYIDQLLLRPVGWAAAASLGHVNELSSTAGTLLLGPGTGVTVSMLVVVLAFSLPIMLLQWYLMVKTGATIGKRILGIRVVHRDGRPVTWGGTILYREVPLFVVSAFPFGRALVILDALPIFFANRLCFHDMIAGTCVIEVGMDRANWTPEAVAESLWDGYVED